MANNKGSMMVRRQLGSLLKRLREAAGKTQQDVDATKIISESTLYRIERGKTAVKEGDVLALARFYGCDSQTTDVLVALAEATRRPGWWEEFSKSLPKDLGLYVGLEEGASSVLTYHPELVHGLFQTEDYARAVIEADERLSTQVVQERLSFRLKRQQAVLERTDPPHIEMILSAAALTLVVGSRSVMEAQITQLRVIDAKEHVSIRILPWTAGAHTSMRGAFALLDFDDPEDPSTVYIETLIGARYIEQDDQVAEYRRVFGLLREKSVTLEEYLSEH